MSEEIIKTEERKTADIARDIKSNAGSLAGLVCELLGRGGAACRCIALSFLVNFIVETLCRQSLYECVVYINNHIFSFLFFSIYFSFFRKALRVFMQKRSVKQSAFS